MSRTRKNIDAILREWSYDPSEISVRRIRGSDGRDVLQMRIDMGLLQLETRDRPDGQKFGEAATYLEHLRDLSRQEKDGFILSDEQCAETDREFVQFYQRRLCWLALRTFDRAVEDADHSLALMDLVRDLSPDEEWTASHEQYRTFILFHRTQAAALHALESDGPEAAIEQINGGLEQIRRVFVELEVTDEFDEDELVERLSQLREAIRDHFQVGRTLAERLAEAVANEEYELAAKLRDEIAQREPPTAPAAKPRRRSRPL